MMETSTQVETDTSSNDTNNIDYDQGNDRERLIEPRNNFVSYSNEDVRFRIIQV